MQLGSWILVALLVSDLHPNGGQIFEYGPAIGDSLPIAIPLQWSATDATPKATDLSILVDLSANQSGPGRKAVIDAVERAIGGLAGGSRVEILRLGGTGWESLGEPAAIGSAPLRGALDRLGGAVPVGSMALRTAMEQALARAARDLPRAILFVGSGDIGGERWAGEDVERLAGQLVSSGTQLVVASTQDGVDPRLFRLANASGGRVLRDGAEAAVALGIPILRQARLQTQPEVDWVIAIPETLAAGRALLAVGKLAGSHPPDTLEVTLEGTLNGEPFRTTWSPVATQNATPESIPDATEAGEARADGMRVNWKDVVENPTAYAEGLAAVPGDPVAWIHQRQQRLVEATLAQAHEALARRDLESARTLYSSANAMETDHPEAQAGLGAVDRLVRGPDPRAAVRPVTERFPGPTPNSSKAEGTKPDVDDSARPDESAPSPGAQPANPDPIEDLKQRDAIEAQRLGLLVARTIREADALARKDPSAAVTLLKGLLETVESSRLEADQRAALRRRIEGALRIQTRRQRSAEVTQLEQDRRVAMAERFSREQDRQQRREQTEKQLSREYNELLRDGRYGEAEVAAERMIDENPDSVAAAASLRAARWTRRAAIAGDIEDRKREAWWDTLADVDAAAVPFPDRQVISYPTAAAWIELTRRREKFKAVDISPVSPAEERIRRSLTQPVSFSFQETPLADVIAFLRDVMDVNIVMDQRGLVEVNVDMETPVTLSLDSVSLRSALRLLLDPLDLTYVIRDEVLLITSETAAEEELVTRIYPVADLVIPIGNFGVNSLGGIPGGANGANAQGGGGLGLGGGGMGAMGGGGGGLRGNRLAPAGAGNLGGRPPANGGAAGDGGAAPPGSDASEELRNLIRRTVSPERWEQSSLAQPGDGSKAKKSGRDRPGPKDWEEHFAARAESEPALRDAIGALIADGRHLEVVALVCAHARHHRTPTWMYQAWALSSALGGGRSADTIAAATSLAELEPGELASTLETAEFLYRLGQPAAAIVWARRAAELHPGSVNALYLTLMFSAASLDVPNLAWSAGRLLERPWPRDGERIHRQVEERLAGAREQLLRAGREADAARLAKLVELERECDLEITLEWAGEADLDLVVIEPGNWLCSAATPQTIAGGVLHADLTRPLERYLATEAVTGRYEILVRRVWGTPAGDRASLRVVRHGGTSRESVERFTVELAKGNPEAIAIELADGRRRHAARLSADVDPKWDPAVQRWNPRQELQQLIETGAVGRNGPGGFGQGMGGRGVGGTLRANRAVRFVTGGRFVAGFGGAVAFDPEITVFLDGATLIAQAVVSADRRYVRLNMAPSLTSIQPLDQVRTIPIQGAVGGF